MPDYKVQPGNQPTEFDPSGIDILAPKVFSAPNTEQSPPSEKVNTTAVLHKIPSRKEDVIRAIVPIFCMLAFCMAIFVTLSVRSNERQQLQVIAKIENINFELGAAKVELDKLQLSGEQDKAAGKNKQKDQEMRLGEVIQNISPLQARLKFKPTMLEKLP